MRQSICKLILYSFIIIYSSLGDDGWEKERIHALFDAEQKDFGIIETVDLKTARAIHRTFQEWKYLARRGGRVSPYKLIISDHGSFMSVILYTDYGINLVGEQHDIFSHQLKALCLDSKTFVPIARHEAWEREFNALKKCSGKNARWGKRDGVDKEAEEPLVPITQIMDDIDIARVISVAVSDWYKHTNIENESSVTLWVSDHESYFCVSFIDMDNVDEKGIPLRGAHHSYIDSKTYSLVTREDAKKEGLERSHEPTNSHERAAL